MAIDPEKLKAYGLPEEVSTTEAAEILGVCKHTVLAYIRSGILPARNAAPPNSSRPAYRLPLADVVELRTTYQREQPRKPPPTRSSAPPAPYRPRHLKPL